MTKIAIIYYSLYGHVSTMAEAVKKGVEAGGATCDIFQVAETLSEDILKAMGAPPKADYPVITAAQMTEYDGFIFGISGRYGAMPAQMKVRSDTMTSLCVLLNDCPDIRISVRSNDRLSWTPLVPFG